MKFLFDDNISYRIVKKLTALFPDSLHVSRTGLATPAPDRSIWDYARQNGYIVVTFDDDFEDLANLFGFPPKVIILRTGNMSTKAVADTLADKKADIESFYASGTYRLLEIY